MVGIEITGLLVKTAAEQIVGNYLNVAVFRGRKELSACKVVEKKTKPCVIPTLKCAIRDKCEYWNRKEVILS